MHQASKCLLLLLTSATLVSAAQAEPTDTTVLKRTITKEGIVNSIVYISPNKKAWQYDSLQSFATLTSGQNKKLFPYGKWVQLYQYKNKFYLYYPCDLGNLSKIDISGKTFREYGVELEDSHIRSVVRIKQNTYSIQITDARGIDKRMIFYLIDENRGIAIRELAGVKDGSRYQLLINAEKIKKMPLIVNYCEEKAEEFSLQKIDYNKLLNR